MKQSFKFIIFLLTLQLWSIYSFSLNDGDVFTALIPLNGDSTVEMTFSVISEINKTARVGINNQKSGAVVSCINNKLPIDIIKIPSSINGYSITIIGSYAFSNCANLKTISIPNSVKSIAKSAFSECI